MEKVVLVMEPDAPRREWKIGRIEAVYPGQDGLGQSGRREKWRSFEATTNYETLTFGS